MSLPSTRSSQQVVAEPSVGGGAAPGSAGGVGVAVAPGASLAGNAVFEMKILSFRFCFIGRFSASCFVCWNGLEIK